MSWLRLIPWQKILALTLVFVIVSFLVFPLTPIAQASSILDNFRSLFAPLTDAPPTRRNSGGAGRGPICALLQEEQDNRYQQAKGFSKNVMALVPKQIGQTADGEGTALQQSAQGGASPANASSDVEFFGGQTIEARPTFWFYLPYIADETLANEPFQNQVAQFVLLDETKHPVWNELMSVELLEKPRLVEYPLAYTLEINKPYSWYFSVICDSDKLSRNPVVRGWVERIEPTPALQTALKNAPRFEEYRAYAENEIWFEAVNSLVKIRRQFPSVNRDAWMSLLADFKVPDNRLYLESAEPSTREVVSGNQLPARM